MLWIKNHQLLTCSLSLAAVFFLSLLLGPSLSCSAVSQSYVLDSSSFSSLTYLCFDDQANYPHCSDFNFLVVDFNQVLPDSTPNFQMPYIQFNISGNKSSYLQYDFMSNYSVFSLDFINNSSNYYAIFINSSSLRNGSNLPSNWSLTLTFYDVLPSDCPEVVPCPEIPDTPYGDKLDKIYNAIMIGSGTMLVIYFFFAIYSMFFGGLKR